MSTRTSLRPQVVFNATDISKNETSLVTVLQSLSRVSYGISWTGSSPVGTIAVQGSNDYSINPNGVVDNAGTWTTLTLEVNGSPVQGISITGNSGTAMIDIIDTAIYALRLTYSFVSGTGNLTATIAGKVS